jgi:hypothetical protein
MPDHALLEVEEAFAPVGAPPVDRLERLQDREHLLPRVERAREAEEVVRDREFARVGLLDESFRLREDGGAQLFAAARHEFELELDARQAEAAGERRRERGEEAARLVGLAAASGVGEQRETVLGRRLLLRRASRRRRR